MGVHGQTFIYIYIDRYAQMDTHTHTHTRLTWNHRACWEKVCYYYSNWPNL